LPKATKPNLNDLASKIVTISKQRRTQGLSQSTTSKRGRLDRPSNPISAKRRRK